MLVLTRKLKERRESLEWLWSQKRNKLIVSSKSKYNKYPSPLIRQSPQSNDQKSNDRLNSKKLFSNREKTIGAANSLLNYGLHSRRSRIRKLSKRNLKDHDISNENEDDKNKTTLVFPTIENPASLNFNFGNLSCLYLDDQLELNHKGKKKNRTSHLYDDSDIFDIKKIAKTKPFDKNEFSVDITKNSNEVLRLLNILKKRKEKREKKAWIPSGAIHNTDGVNLTQKVYY